MRENPQAEDAMDMDQTWPTQEEMAGSGDITQKRRLAPGTSDYQACWILEDDEDAVEDDEEENEPRDSNMDTAAAADGTHTSCAMCVPCCGMCVYRIHFMRWGAHCVHKTGQELLCAGIHCSLCMCSCKTNCEGVHHESHMEVRRCR